jgi:hypothetical protein
MIQAGKKKPAIRRRFFIYYCFNGAMFLGTERPTLCLLLFLLWLPQGQFSSPATLQCALTAIAGRSLKKFFSVSTFFWTRMNSLQFRSFFHSKSLT